MKLWEEYLGDNYEPVDTLKESPEGNVSLLYDKIGKQLCVLKERDLHSKEIYQALKELADPHIPFIYRMIEQKGKLLLLEEYAEGRTLAELIRYETNLPREKLAYHILRELCAALSLLHDRNIIHRDIKPSNIILTKNHEVKLIDFSIARMARDSEEPDTEFLGTKGYAPPEQYGFGQTDTRSDIYSLGITLWRFLGRDYHGPLKKILQTCTALDPALRYQSADELLQDMEHQQKQHRLKQWGLALSAALLLSSVLWLTCMPKQPSTEEVPSPAPSATEADTHTVQEASPVTPAASSAEPPPLPKQETAPAPAITEERPALPSDTTASSTEPGVSRWIYPQLNKSHCTFYLNGSPCSTGIPIPAEVWKDWEQKDGIVQIPSDWSMTLHIDNESAADVVTPVVKSAFDGTERITRQVTNRTIPSGESADFIIPLNGFRISGKLGWLRVRLEDAAGSSFYWEFQFYLEN